jgi:hypothetical protein
VPSYAKNIETHYNEVLAGVEMPSLCIQLGALTHKKDVLFAPQIADAIVQGITHYVTEKKFLKGLYKPSSSGTLKITSNHK